jgi:hypothetical protein
MATLIIRTGKHKGREIAIPPQESFIGRDEGCFIRLSSTEISRQHCMLRSTPQGIVIRDLGSRNGTHVNGQRLQGETLLERGDILRVGTVEFEVPGAKPASAELGLDDTIAEWLTDGDTSHGPAADARHSPPPSTHEMQIPGPQPHAPKPPSSERREFRSVAEEARDIIRRHQELAAQNDE